MKQTSRKLLPAVAAWLLTLTPALYSCGSDDEDTLSGLLAGRWYMWDYDLVVDGDSDAYELSFDSFTFDGDSTVVVSYLLEPQLDTGFYEAGNDYIRLEFDREDERRMELFQVLHFSAERIEAKYFNSTERDVEGTITLSREQPPREVYIEEE